MSEDNKVEIQDIQIRLTVEIDGVHVVCSWYGPKDKMRFARVKRANRLISTEESLAFEAQAKELFTKKIEELEKLLAPVTKEE
jgi:hypothetical protein